MKRWAVLTVLLYALALLVLTVPVLLTAFGDWGGHSMTRQDILGVFQSWAYWLWLAILIAGQFLLLLLPIHIAERRLPARRPLKTPVLVTAFFLANLVLTGLFAILCAVFGDEAGEYFDLSLPLQAAMSVELPATGSSFVCTAILTLLVFWLVWAFAFRRFAKVDDEQSLVKRSTRWLLRGSILELLIAVPSHVIVRRRDDCCAPMGTFWGIATGISLMLLCFGPGVYFLFVERCRKLKPRPVDTDKPS